MNAETRGVFCTGSSACSWETDRMKRTMPGAWYFTIGMDAWRDERRRPRARASRSAWTPGDERRRPRARASRGERPRSASSFAGALRRVPPRWAGGRTPLGDRSAPAAWACPRLSKPNRSSRDQMKRWCGPRTGRHARKFFRGSPRMRARCTAAQRRRPQSVIFLISEFASQRKTIAIANAIKIAAPIALHSEGVVSENV